MLLLCSILKCWKFINVLFHAWKAKGFQLTLNEGKFETWKKPDYKRIEKGVGWEMSTRKNYTGLITS